MSLIDVALPPRCPRAIPPHVHDGFDETILVLSGRVVMTLGNNEYVRHQDEFLFIPRGSVHALANPSDVAARVLFVIVPGLLVRKYFEDLAPLVTSPSPDRKALSVAMARHGVRLPD